MIELYAVRINKDIELSTFNKLTEYTSIENKEKISDFFSYKDSQRTLIGDLLARYIICKKYNMKNTDIIFFKNEYGKPFLKNYPHFYFNISHSKDYVVCAVSDMPIGIDIELVKNINLNVAKRFFSASEYNYLLTQPKEEQLDYFYKLWTLKESYIKAVGKGLSIPLNSFSINICNDDITITSRKQPTTYIFYHYNISFDYKLSICVKKNNIYRNDRRTKNKI